MPALAALAGVLPGLIITAPGCGVKMSQLPVISYPYVSEVEFLKEVKNINGKAKKKRFKNDRITAPFYFLLKIKEIENDGTLSVRFYPTAGAADAEENRQKAAEKTFHFGQEGKYYEYIIFFDRIEGLIPGKYRYGIFCNQRLIYEDQLIIFGSLSAEAKPVGGE